MHQAVLMNAEIDESAKVRHVRHRAFQFHSLLEVGDILYVLAEFRNDELVARIAAGLEQFFANVGKREFAGLAFK